MFEIRHTYSRLRFVSRARGPTWNTKSHALKTFDQVYWL